MLLNDKGHIKLIDFGTAKLLVAEQCSDDGTSLTAAQNCSQQLQSCSQQLRTGGRNCWSDQKLRLSNDLD